MRLWQAIHSKGIVGQISGAPQQYIRWMNLKLNKIIHQYKYYFKCEYPLNYYNEDVSQWQGTLGEIGLLGQN